MSYLKYIGKGSFIFGVPARDLSEAEARKHGVKKLLESGLYTRPTKKPKPAENKLEAGPSNSKGD